jgi:hypothetical protein
MQSMNTAMHRMGRRYPRHGFTLRGDTLTAHTLRTDYPAKVPLAWGAAIGGDLPLRNWLLKNGYPELGGRVGTIGCRGSSSTSS